MDALYPFLPRLHPEDAKQQPLIAPVGRYVSIAGLDPTVPHRVGWQEPKKKRQQATPQQSSHAPDGGHETTPEAEQHVDAQGHLDIYV